MILVGDIATMADGNTGIVVEVWGTARTFVRVKKDLTGKTIPLIASDIVEYRRPKPVVKSKWGRR